MIQKGYPEALHGDLSQQQRNRILAKLNQEDVLCYCNDVAQEALICKDLLIL